MKPTPRPATSLARTAALCTLAGAFVPLAAQTIKFDGGAHTPFWGNAVNWEGNVLPGSGNLADLNGREVFVNSTASINGVRNTDDGSRLELLTGGSLTVGSGHISVGGGTAKGLVIDVRGGALSTQQIITTSATLDSAAEIYLSGGSLTASNRLHLTNTNTATAKTNRLMLSGGSLSVGSSGFALYGADSGDRASLEIAGSDGAFGSASQRFPVTLANTSASVSADTAATVKFTLMDAASTTLYASNLTVAGNRLIVDASSLLLPAGTYNYTLIDYSGTLTGSFTPVYWGLRPGESATVTHNATTKKFTASVTLAAGRDQPVTVSDFNLPAQNAQGWTILTPASDSRLIYVDPVNGNDSTGTFHLPGSSAVGSNPQAPTGAIQPVKTLAAANALLREDQPDWILLKAGGVWTGEQLDLKRGRSAAERAVVCAYGTGARPELRTGSLQAIKDNQLVNVIIQGVRFWAHTRDSDGPYFFGNYAGGNGLSLFTRAKTDARQVRDILIEDCFFRSYNNNSLTGNGGENGDIAPIERFVLRRSIISGNYSVTGHSQGLYYAGGAQPIGPRMLLQENTFDHNGWRIQSISGNNEKSQGQATIFNHNTYFTDAKGTILEKNLFLRASSIGNKWTSGHPGASAGLVIDNNLYVEGEIGISLGGNFPEAGHRFREVSIRNNVFSDLGRSRPTNRYLSWGVQVQDWQNGEVVDNLIVHQRNTSISNTFALTFPSFHKSSDVLVAGNVFANLRGGGAAGSALVQFESGAIHSNIVFEDNVVQSPTATPLARLGDGLGGYGFGGANRYHSAAAAGQHFAVGNTYANLAAWQSATGDAGALTGDPGFPAPTRDVEGYVASLGLGSTFQHFIDAVYGQSKANWNPALTAPAVNDWLRAGFDLGSSGGSSPAWSSQDVGAVGVAGSTSYDSGTGAFTLQASGADIFSNVDEFRYVTLDGDLQGDGEIVARVASLTNTHSWAKAGVMIRDGLANNAKNVAVVVSPNNQVSFQYRSASGGYTTTVNSSGLGAPRWLKLVRSGNDFTGYHSANGVSWTQIGSTVSVTMPAAAEIGLCATSHNDSVLMTTVIDNVTATP